MPLIVPRVDETAGGAVPQAAPEVAPVKNAAPQQIQQLGAAVSSAGMSAFQTGRNIGIKVQDTINDANVRKAETQLLQQGTQITTDYTHKLGEDAISGYEGATQDLAQAKDDAAAGLTNDIQKRMFSYVAQQHLTGFGRQMADHNFQQTTTYGIKESNTRADQMGQMAAGDYSNWQNADGNYATYKQKMLDEADKSSQMAGIAPDSAQGVAMRQQKTSALAQQVLTRMMDSDQWDEAQHYYDTALANHELDDSTARTFGNAVTEGHTGAKSKDLGAEALQSALGGSTDQQRTTPVQGGSITSTPSVSTVGGFKVTDIPGTARPGGRVHDGIDIAVPVGTQIIAPANGTVSKVWNDDKFGGGLSMEVTYPNGYTEGFAHLSAQNYQAGQQVSQGAVLGLSGQTGNATGPTVHWMMRDPDGKVVDPRSVGPAPKDPKGFTDPDQAQSALDYVRNSDANERVKAGAESYVLRQYSQARELDQQQYQQVKNAATDYYYQHNGSIDGLPASIKSQLKPADAYSLSKPIPVESDPDTMTNLILHPEQVTPDNVKAQFAAGKLSKSEYYTFLQRAVTMDNKPDKMYAATVDSNTLKYLADKAGIPDMYAPKTEDENRDYSQLLYRCQQDVDLAQQRAGQPLPQAQKEQIINQELSRFVMTRQSQFTHPSTWFRSNTVQSPYRFQMPPGAAGIWTDPASGKNFYVDADKKNLGEVPE